MTQGPTDRRTTRAARRAEARNAAARRTEPQRSSGSRWLVPALIGAAVVVAAVLAIVLPGAGSGSGRGSSTVPPASAGSGGSASASASVAGVIPPPTITGDLLPDFQGPTGDPAVGRPAPEVQGQDFDGAPTSIEADGNAKILLFLAHWCPHCQEEVPLVQQWVASGGVPEDVDLVSVATGIDASAPNYPPDAWLEREGWTVPVIVDPTNTVARAYGLPAFPYWVFIGPDGTVRGRATGELPIADLEATIRALTSS
jgi:thiol-disulfide isomerase/thioredoxin